MVSLAVQSAHSHLGRGLYFGDDVAGLLDGSIRNIQFWLRNIVHRTQAERAQSGFRTSIGERGDHDHRHGMATHQLFEECQAIHPRHLDIESEYIGMESLDFFPGHKRIRCCTDHFQFRIRAENLRQQLAHERRIIDDKHLIW